MPRRYIPSFRNLQSVALLFGDLLLIALGFAGALWLRFEFSVPDEYVAWGQQALPILLVARLGTLTTLRLHHWSFRLSGLSEAIELLKAQFFGSLAFVVLTWMILGRDALGPRGVLVLEALLSTSLIGGVRFLPRGLSLQRWFFRGAPPADAPRAVILGVSDTAAMLIREIHQSAALRPVGLLDDRESQQGVSIQGVRVIGRIADLPAIARDRRIRQVVIASPDLVGPRLREVLSLARELPLTFQIYSLGEMDRACRRGSNGNGGTTIHASERLRAIQPQDLLPRPEVSFIHDELAHFLRDRGVLITGAAGSIGAEMARQVARYGARELVLADMNESGLYMLNLELGAEHPTVRTQLAVIDLRDRAATHRLLAEFRPSLVFHAAAHKHVPLLERAPEEAIKNNVFGTRNLAEAAVATGVETFLLISTDKAVNPTSVMGASKRVSESIIRDFAARQGVTAFTAVRFGNVLGSSGSVVPIFKEQIRRGRPVTVTHPEMRRYLMTTGEAVALCIYTAARRFGAVAVLEMGEMIRIQDLARSLITLAGLVPDRDIEITYTGLRPGEKLFEELMTEAEEKTTRVHSKVTIVDGHPLPPDFRRWLADLELAAARGERDRCRRLLKTLVPTYAHPVPEPAPTATPQKHLTGSS